MAHTGFSRAAMAINMPAIAVLMAWIVALGVLGWKRAASEPRTNPPPGR
jgi:hypothetical protein